MGKTTTIKFPSTMGKMSGHKKGGFSTLVHVLFVCLHSVSLYYCFDTMGLVHEEALSTRQDLEWGDDPEIIERLNVDPVAAEVAANLFDEPLPSQFLPSFFATVFFMAGAFFHTLFTLCIYWSVTFRCLMDYLPSSQIEEGSFICIIPPKHKGKAEIVPVKRAPLSQCLYFDFQRQRYEVLENIEEGAQEIAPVRCPDDLTLRSFFESPFGFQTEADISLAKEKFGTNSFEIPKPGFWDLYLTQLASPVAVFQFFCSILWLLDEYWKYTLFTLGMILVFEATTAFTRLKNISTLSGMSSPAYPIAVYRKNKWETIANTELLPGDIISLRCQSDATETMVPCDGLLLKGSAVANESTLTGESIPQLKDAAVVSPHDLSDGVVPLSMQGAHRTHILFSGTQLMQVDAAMASSSSSSSSLEVVPSSGLPETPDGGCLVFVLRTGFSSSQGELMKMIEFSTHKVSGNVKETALLLSMLLVFALTASGYVFWKGMEDGRRSKYGLLLRCTQIITSVVPADLPMQTGLAVNTALMGLLKAHVYCTEPHRVPLAGRVTDCLFDKTGTLTTDKLEALGTVPPSVRFRPSQPLSSSSSSSSKALKSEEELNELVPVAGGQMPLKLVVAGCHALVNVGDKLVGDPVDSAALKAIQWTYSHSSLTAFNVPPPKKDEKKDEKKDDKKDEKKEEKKEEKKDRTKDASVSVKVCHRNRFQSKLQRMSSVAIVKFKDAKSSSGLSSGVYCLVKGSPEVIMGRLGKVPEHYSASYRAMASRGMRVIAFAFKRVSNQDLGLPKTENLEALAEAVVHKPRDFVERNLIFCGFIAFACRVRKDSRACIRSLKESDHRVIMLTGDAPLTAFHVGKQVALVRSEDPGYLLASRSSSQLEWVEIKEDEEEAERIPFDAEKISELARTKSLVVTGSSFLEAVEVDSKTWDKISDICIFARMAPEGKEQIVKKMKEQRRFVLMCGDGGNDVGALKQAHIGLALLSGFGNANAETSSSSGSDDISGEDELKRFEAESAEKMKVAAIENSKKATTAKKKFKEDTQEKQMRYMQEELEKLRAKGETGVMANITAMASAVSRIKNEVVEDQQTKRKDIAAKHGGAVGHSASQLTQFMGESEEGEVPMVKLGDASIAAPFTSKMPSIRSVMGIIRQGRCTLVSTVQQQQILVLNCLITAYCLSALSLEGSRNSEAQMIATGVMLVIASMAFTFAKPLDRLSSVKPLPTVFHPASFVSLIGQVLLHLICLYQAVGLAKEVMGEEELKDLIMFQKDAAKKYIETGDEELLTKHKPNLLNTVVFLVETAQQVSVMAVNYKGRPWTKSVSENTALLWSLFATAAGVFVCSFEVFPELNELLNLVPLPSDEFRTHVLVLLFISICGALLWDRLCVFLFARDVFLASWFEAQLSPSAIFSGAKYVILAVLGIGLLYLFDFNIFTIGLMYLGYRQYKKMTEPAAPASASSPPASSSK